MNKEDLYKRKHELELVRDQLWSELIYVDELMRRVGFTDGLNTVKATASELVHLEDAEESDAA